MLLDDPVADVRAIVQRSGLQSGTAVAPDHGGEAMCRHLLMSAVALFVPLMPASVDAAWLRARPLAADLRDATRPMRC